MAKVGVMETGLGGKEEEKSNLDEEHTKKRKHTVWTDDHGEPIPYDPNFRGPLEKRSCTDVICLFAFVLFLAAWGVLAFFAIIWGNPKTLIYPSDSQGRICGTSIKDRYNLTGKPYLMFFDLTQCISFSTVFEGCATPQVCVAKCPDYYFSYLELLLLREEDTLSRELLVEVVKEKLVCVDEKTKASLSTPSSTFADVEKAVSNGKCAIYVVDSVPIVGRCIPRLIADAGDKLTEQKVVESMDNMTMRAGHDQRVPNATRMGTSESFVKLMLEGKEFGEALLSDLQWSWWQIFGFLVASGFVAFVWVVLMRWISAIMIWISITIVVLSFAAATAVCWYFYFTVKKEGGLAWQWTINYKAYPRMPKFWLVLGIIASIFFVIISLVLLFLRSRIQVAIAMIKESSKAVTHIMSTLFFPVVPFILELIVFAWFAVVGVHLAAWGVPNCRIIGLPPNASQVSTVTVGPNFAISNSSDLVNGSRCSCDILNHDINDEPFCKFVNYTKESNLVFLGQAINLFGLFWCLFFVGAMGELTLAGAFASYYWAFRKPEDIPKMPVLRGLWRVFRYHLGSVAFGSLVLAIVRFIRAIFEYVENKLKFSENPIAIGLLKSLRCCCWCLEACLRFLTKNAYIMIAIYGNNFCASARDAFTLLMRNAVRVWVLDKVTDFLLFLGKLVITVGMGALSFFYFSGFWKWNEVLVGNLNHYWVPVVIVTLGTYLICCAFFGVYEMAVDTTFLCFLEDSERNDGTPQKPFFMSKQLMKILNKKNQFHREKAK